MVESCTDNSHKVTSNDLDKLVECLNDGINAFPCWRDDAFIKLWCKNRLSTRLESKVNMDGIDKVNATLLWSAIENKNQVLIGMPGKLPHRSSALLATALIKAFLDSRDRAGVAKDVVYLGTRLGIREDLSRVTLNRDSLQEYFSVTFSRRDMASEAFQLNDLPRLVCIYSPVDPISSLRQVNPFLIAVECNDQAEVPWLSAVIDYAQKNRIPTIAWSSNHLSEVHANFHNLDSPRFTWPASFLHRRDQREKLTQERPVELFLLTAQDINLCPCELTGEDVDDYTSGLIQAQYALSRAQSGVDGQLSRDAVLIGYRLLRILERLPVSLSTYEFERTQYWRQPSIDMLCTGLGRFANALKSQEIAEPILQATRHLQKSRDWLEDHDPPMWSALVDLCIEDRDEDEQRVLVFSSEAHKEMFAHSLLAHEGVSESDLVDMGISVSSITGLGRALSENTVGKTGIAPVANQLVPNHTSVPFLIGIPSGHNIKRILPIIRQAKADILYYPHQSWQLKWLADWLNTALAPDIQSALRTVDVLRNREARAVRPNRAQQIVIVHPSRSVQGRPRPTKREIDSTGPLDIGTPSEELNRLLSEFDETNELQNFAVSSNETGTLEEGDQGPDFVENAIGVTFSGGWFGLFATDERLNFVRSNHEIERRFIRSARPKDRVLYIHGESQQSLYELLISRVHNHHSIRTHVEYIRVWQQEAREGIQTYLRSGHSLDELHAELVQRGSMLQTPVAIYFWARGLVMRPRDVEDLRRLSDVLEMPFTSKCYNLIHNAGDRLHGLHIQLSRRLKAWIMKGASGGHMRDEIIDNELQLTFGDVQDALLLLEVLDVREMNGLFITSTLGALRRSDTHDGPR